MGKYHSEDNSGSGSGAGVESLVRLWLLRLLIRLETFRKHIRETRRHYPDDELIYSLAEVFDIDMESCKKEDDDIDYKEVLERLHGLYVTGVWGCGA